MLELIFDKYFKKVEGTRCSHDKSRFIIRKIFEAFQENAVLTLQDSYDIINHPKMKEIENDFPYWCPKPLKTTYEAIQLAYATITINLKKLAEFIPNK